STIRREEVAEGVRGRSPRRSEPRRGDVRRHLRELGANAMSYTRTRRPLQGTTSQPPGPRVFRGALGDDTVVLKAYRDPRPIYSRGKISSWIRHQQSVGSLGSLGDDTLDADAQWKQDLLQTQRDLLEAQKHWADGDKTIKILGVVATLSIPLAAAIWRKFGIG